MPAQHPHFGHTKSGLPVHLHTLDHLPTGPGVLTRFNRWAAAVICAGVGTMYCAYAFAVLDAFALPQAIRGGAYGLVQWTASFFLQLVLLSIVMVNQNAQSSASDARASKTFEDCEALMSASKQILGRLDALAAQPQALDAAGDAVAEIPGPEAAR